MRLFQLGTVGVRFSVVAVLALGILCSGCKKEIDKESLSMYVQNNAGLERIQELMSTGTKQPGLRLAALTLVVEKGLSAELPRRWTSKGSRRGDRERKDKDVTCGKWQSVSRGGCAHESSRRHSLFY